MLVLPRSPRPTLAPLIGRHSFVLNQDTLVYPHHLDINCRNDYSETMVEMVPPPVAPPCLGPQKRPGHAWTTVPPAGAPIVEVASGRSVSLVPALRIRFGTSEGTVL